MPTSRPRHSITQTDDVAAALDAAAREWPEDRGAPGRLLLRLLHEGHRAISGQREEELTRRRAAIERSSGMFTDCYPARYLEKPREDWPE